MLKIGSKNISAIRIGEKVVVSMYKGATLVWQAISSCFGLGCWINNYTWKNDDAWKN